MTRYVTVKSDKLRITTDHTASELRQMYADEQATFIRNGLRRNLSTFRSWLWINQLAR